MIDVTETHAFFYKEWPSNFRTCRFEYTSMFTGETREFFCTEQAFMWEKANRFGDTATAERIMKAETPMTAKELGRTVKPFDTEEWDKVRYEVMYRVNLEKYRQDDELRGKLLDPKFDGKTFVEASPVDSIWGICMPMGTDEIDDERNWQGRNLLGKVITDVRKQIKEESGK